MDYASMPGFTRTTYDIENKLKCTTYYPPGWRQGDRREPVVHLEHYQPEPPRRPLAEFSRYYERQPAPVGDLPPRLPRAPPAPSTAGAGASNGAGSNEGSNPQWSHYLKSYLAKAWMPKYLLGSGVDVSVRHEWPIIPSLSRPAGTRKLLDIGRIDEFVLSNAVALWKDQMADIRLTPELAEQGKLDELTLPDVSHCFMDEEDFRLLQTCQLSFANDVTRLLKAYPLRTVLRVLKFFYQLPEDHAMYTRMRFHDVNHLCPVQDVSLFDLIALPGHTDTDISLLMVVVPPWDIRFDDLEEFVSVGNREGDIDLTSNAPPSPSDVLWAVIWDICKSRDCRFFVLTNYDSWVFGSFSQDMKRAHLSTHLPAPVFPAADRVNATHVCSSRLPVPNVFECLLLWMVTSMDPDHAAFPLPPNVPNMRRPRRS